MVAKRHNRKKRGGNPLMAMMGMSALSNLLTPIISLGISKIPGMMPQQGTGRRRGRGVYRPGD